MKVKGLGDLKGYADLGKFRNHPHLYAVGPVEGLQGEVTIFDGKPFIAKMHGKKAKVHTKSYPKACFLVYAQVKRWNKTVIPDSVKSKTDLEAFILMAAERQRLSPKEPFVFLVKGTAKRVNYHIIHWTGKGKFGHEQHEKAKVQLRFQDKPVKIVGFHSDHHQGVFTCMGNFHMHVITQDNKHSGHMDDLQLGSGCRLFLPARR